MKTKRFWKRLLPAILVLLLLSGGLIAAASDCGVYHKLLRLHVLANSDSAEDQAVKLLVRDRVIKTLEPVFTVTYSSIEALEEAVRERFPALQAAAEEVLRENGFSYGVRVTLTKEAYPTRAYENLTLPAGVYHSLRVLLGDGGGHNWWCVLYPPLCLFAAKKEEPPREDGTGEGALLQVGLTKDEAALVLPKSEDGRLHFRFRLLELLGELRGKLQK